MVNIALETAYAINPQRPGILRDKAMIPSSIAGAGTFCAVLVEIRKRFVRKSVRGARAPGAGAARGVGAPGVGAAPGAGAGRAGPGLGGAGLDRDGAEGPGAGPNRGGPANRGGAR